MAFSSEFVKDDPAFPYSMTLDLPFPTHRLAETALRVLDVDQELSQLVRREYTLTTSTTPATPASTSPSHPQTQVEQDSTLRISYQATTNRMLRVAFNSLMESLGTVVGVMRELDVEVLGEDGVVRGEAVEGVERDKK